MAAAFGCALVAEAGSAPDRGAARVLTYRDVSGYSPAVAFAIRSWNEARTGIRFVPSRRGQTPDFTIRSAPTVRGHAGDAAGLGSRGFGVLLSRKWLGNPRWLTQYQIKVAAHELGHVLGLPHNHTACSVMSTASNRVTGVGGGERACLERRGGRLGDGYFRCGPDQSDARAVAARHGLPAPPANRGVGFCRAPTGLLAASYAEVQLVNEGQDVQVRARNTGSTGWTDAVFLDVLHTPGDAFRDLKLVAPDQETTIPPGGTANFTFGVDNVCPGTEVVFQVRLLESRFNVYFGGIQTMRVRTPGPPPGVPRPPCP